jgi:hypothetical protein
MVLMISLTVSAMANECILVGNDFSLPVSIWGERWAKYNGYTPTISTNVFNEVSGWYIPSTNITTRTKRPELSRRWKQVGGRNEIWWGDRLNPRDSYDTWYIGDPSCAQVPATRCSIPRLPTFIPNEKGSIDINLNPWRRTQSNGTPSVVMTVMSDDEMGSLTNNIYGTWGSTDPTPTRITSISCSSGMVSITWETTTSGNFVILGSSDLVTWTPVAETTSSQATLASSNMFFRIQRKMP